MSTPSRSWRADDGNLSVYFVSLTLGMIVVLGMVVDLGGYIRAQQHADAVAQEAARTGAQQIDGGFAIPGYGVRLDPDAAKAATDAYLAGSGLEGSSEVAENTITVETRATYEPIFLSVIAISDLPVTGRAKTRVTRVFRGEEV